VTLIFGEDLGKLLSEVFSTIVFELSEYAVVEGRNVGVDMAVGLGCYAHGIGLVCHDGR